jgi:hypothetical protein
VLIKTLYHRTLKSILLHEIVFVQRFRCSARIGIDLNKGAGGEFIYLWYTKAKTKSPVKDMGVAFDNVGWPEYESVFWLNSQSPADVNKSVGGATIIIKYKR